jgi:hypothetical protein
VPSQDDSCQFVSVRSSVKSLSYFVDRKLVWLQFVDALMLKFDLGLQVEFYCKQDGNGKAAVGRASTQRQLKYFGIEVVRLLFAMTSVTYVKEYRILKWWNARERMRRCVNKFNCSSLIEQLDLTVKCV